MIKPRASDLGARAAEAFTGVADARWPAATSLDRGSGIRLWSRSCHGDSDEEGGEDGQGLHFGDVGSK
jgi:hypothetical protein